MGKIADRLRAELKRRAVERGAQAYDVLHDRAADVIEQAKESGAQFVLDQIEDRLAEVLHSLAGRYGFDLTYEQKIANTQSIAAANLYAAAHPEQLPASASWEQWSGEVWQQLTCGSCVPCSTLACVSLMVNIIAENPDFDARGNVNELFSNIGGKCNVGANPEDALRYLRDVGVGRESDWPYEPSDHAPRTLPSFLRISDYVVLHGRQEMRQWLSKHGPIIAGVNVHESMYNYRSGVYREGYGAMLGAHCIYAYGYDDTQSAFQVQQPWGEQFGMNGRMLYGYNSSIDNTHPAYGIIIAESDLPQGAAPGNRAPVVTGPTPDGPVTGPAFHDTIEIDADPELGLAGVIATSAITGAIGPLINSYGMEAAKKLLLRLIAKRFG